MFAISSPQLPISSNLNSNGGGTIATIDTELPNNFAAFTTVRSSNLAIAIPITNGTTFTGGAITNGATFTNGAIINGTTFTEGAITIDVKTLMLQSVEAVEVLGVRYTPASNAESVAPGEFLWDFYNETIVLISLSPISTDARIVLYAVTDLFTDYCSPPYPSIFSLVPMEGSFSWEVGFEGQPGGSFEFTTHAYLKQAVIQSLTPGGEFSAYDVGFRVNAISITELPASKSPQRLIKVSVSLGGKQENYLDRIVNLVPPGAVIDDNLDCLGKITEAKFLASEYPSSTTVQALASRSGTSFSGVSMNIDIPRDTPRNQGITFISKATEQVRQHGCFLRYSDYSGVRAINLDSVPTHSFTEKEVLSPISASIAGKKISTLGGAGSFGALPIGTVLPSVVQEPPQIAISSENQSIYPFVHTYEPRCSLSGRFEADEEKYLTESSQGSAQENAVPMWKRRERVIQEIPDGDLRPDIPPANTGALKDLSNNFSSSGITKTYKLDKTIDGLPQSQYLQRWGFAFLAAQMYSNDEKTIPGARNVWQMIEEKTTTYLYDDQTGYQLGSDTVGWELTRFSEETGKETVTLNTGKEADLAKRKLYEYFKLPYRKQDRVLLEALRSYYVDIGFPPVEVYPVCLPNGKKTYRAVFDPTYVEPFFAAVTTTHENSFKAIPDPDSTTAKPLPPKTTGKEAFFRKNVTVLASKTTTTSAEASFSAHNDNRAEDSYNEYNSQFSSTDAGFSNSAENTNFTRQPNRPPIATKLPPLDERIEPENLAGKPQAEPILYNYYAETSYDTFYRSGGIKSSGAASTEVVGSSLSYPAAKTLALAQAAARTEINISNIKDCLQESLAIPFSPQIKEGDRLNYTCNGTVRQRRVLSISHEVRFNGLVGGVPIVTSPGSKVTLGLERKTNVTFSKEKQPPIPKADDGYNLKVFFVPDTYPMGEIQDPDMPTRRNFTL